MATIVRCLKEHKDYVLVGTGFGAFHSETPNVFFGNFAPDQKSGRIPIVFICNSAGKVGWLDANHVEVLSVDGMSPSQYLPSTF